MSYRAAADDGARLMAGGCVGGLSRPVTHSTHDLRAPVDVRDTLGVGKLRDTGDDNGVAQALVKENDDIKLRATDFLICGEMSLCARSSCCTF